MLKKPGIFVFSNLAMSIDGKIATADRAFFPLGTVADRKQMALLRKKADALLMGANTLRVYGKPCLAAGSKSSPANIVLSSCLQGISPDWSFFRHPHLRRILFVGAQTPRRTVLQFSKKSEVIVLRAATPKNPTALQILKCLEVRGFRNLLIEGGGEVMWDFVQFEWIDEYHVTLTPKLIGGVNSPTLVDGKGFMPSKVPSLKLLRCKRVGDEIYLTYRR